VSAPGRIELGERVARYLERRWGGDDLGTFRCPLPRHEGRARLVDQDGDLRLGCCRGRWRSIGEVVAAEGYRTDQLRTNKEIAFWTRRIAHEAGEFEAEPVELPELAADADGPVTRAHEGFALLLRVRWADGPHVPAAFSIRFAAAWCGLSLRDARYAIGELQRLGVIRHTGSQGRVREYLPGEVGWRGWRLPEQTDEFFAAVIEAFPGSREVTA
jgi:hypothetical protein